MQDRVLEVALFLKHKGLLKYLPWRFIKHYLYPFTIQRKKIHYNPQIFFESYYSIMKNGFSDRITMAPDKNPRHARYHYNAVENSIITYFESRHPIEGLHVLDVGTGAGHWIDFYLEVFQAAEVYDII